MSRALLLLLLALPLAAQTSVEERLAALEAQMKELREKNDALEQKVATLSAENDSLKKQTPVKAAGKEPKLSIGGLLQAQAESGGRPDARFVTDNDRVFLRRARVNVQGQFAEEFDFRLELDAAGSLANASAQRAQLTDAYITWTRHPIAHVRVGQFKTPFGFEQLYSDPRLLAPERTLTSDRLTLGRQVGIQLGGDLVKERLRYAVGAFNGNGTNSAFNDDEGFLVAARLSGTILDRKGLRVAAGANGYRSDDTTALADGERHGWGADAQLTVGRAEIWGELLRTGGTVRGEGWSLQTSYDLVPDRWQAVVRYDSLRDTLDPEDSWLAGANYYIKGHDLKLQLHLLRSDDDTRVIARLQTVF